MESEKKWYVIHTYSGYENKVMATLERKVKSMGLENVINRILVPMEEEIDVGKDGKKRAVKRKDVYKRQASASRPCWLLLPTLLKLGLLSYLPLRLSSSPTRQAVNGLVSLPFFPSPSSFRA